jgi:hypothetical protein
MIYREQIELNVCRAYIRRVQEKFPSGTYMSNRFLLILQIREWQLKRRLRKIPLKIDELSTLKTGIREAEIFLHEIAGGEPKWVAEEITEILCAVILELIKEVVHTEEALPHLKPYFDRERAEYRRMKLEAEEAMLD